jgi:hypothetical protein
MELMSPTAALALGLFSRWLHISCVVILIGSVFYAWRTTRTFAPGFSSVVYAAAAGIVASGLYNLFTKPSYPPGYHMWFGIKMLLVLHVLAAIILLTRRSAAPSEKQSRTMAGIITSGAIVIAVSAYLRWISMTPVVTP